MADDETLDTSQYNDIAKQWTTFLDQPGGRAALLQAGIAMSQPLAWGQSNFGAFTGALGSAGEAVGRVEGMDIRKQEAESKAALREAQAQMAETRAGAAGSKAETANRALDIKTQGLQLKAWRDLTTAHQNYIKPIEERNNNILRDPKAPKEPVPTLEEFIRTVPSARAAAEASGLFGTTGTTTPGTFANPETTSTPRAAAPTSGGVVTVRTPEEAQKLKPGTRYRNPQGEEYTR